MAETLNSEPASGPTSRKIKTAIPIPNLIEVQKRSYERFLQMHTRAGGPRAAIGLQGVFKSIFPIKDFRETCSLEFVEYTIGNWECKCGELQGIEHLRSECEFCGHRLVAPDARGGEVVCQACGNLTPVEVARVRRLRRAGRAASSSTTSRSARSAARPTPSRSRSRSSSSSTTRIPDTEAKSIRDIKEQEVYFGEIPMLTDNGTFIVNGTERVIVSQLHRSPGRLLPGRRGQDARFMAKVIPYRGSWVEFETDHKNILYVRIDRKRKFPATVFLRALGLEDDRDDPPHVLHAGRGARRATASTSSRSAPGWSAASCAPRSTHPKTGEELVKKGRRDPRRAGRGSCTRPASSGSRSSPPRSTGAFTRRRRRRRGDRRGAASRPATPLTDETLDELVARGHQRVRGRLPRARGGRRRRCSRRWPRTRSRTQNEALLEIYRRLRPGDPPTLESSRTLFNNMFFDPTRYDFSRGRPAEVQHQALRRLARTSGRETIARALGQGRGSHAVAARTSSRSCATCSSCARASAQLDDIDHLGNRRVRSVGELLENQFRIGLVRMERAIKEKMSVYQEMTTAMPHDLINAKPVMAAIQEFFGSSQLSQFMDQTNPLSEVTHKRRLSALGPGGLSRERAGFEVRDVHPTHYGRICPIETPEGPNIGLISSLSCYARINDYGFIESPYRKVEDGQVRRLRAGRPHRARAATSCDEVVRAGRVRRRSATRSRKQGKMPPEAVPHSFYLAAWEEDRAIIAQANAQLDRGRRVRATSGSTRGRPASSSSCPREEVGYIDVSPKQLVSVAASLIPFLENDDANRALMGSNMQRQAVPLLRPQAPLVGTGMEAITARDSGAVVTCKRAGVVDLVDSQRIIVRVGAEGREDFGADIYTLTKFKRSNQNTCINQRPIVREGQRVEAGQVLADGPCTERGELALGRNVLVAFMPWRGYNFEDAILVSEKLVKDDSYTSIHIEEFEVEARDTKLGPEEITRDIPNVSEEFLKDLDEAGVIRIGAHVKPGDILVGKVTPKGETQLTPEEKLLRAIFGEKAGDVRDASLTTPPGHRGHRRRRQDLLPQGRREGRARAGRSSSEEIERMREGSAGPDPHHPRGGPQEADRAARGRDAGRAADRPPARQRADPRRRAPTLTPRGDGRRSTPRTCAAA